MMKFINQKTIELDREISDLDKFVLKFINILKKHTEYVLISGYVAILLGRSRTTEDVDLFIPRLSRESFSKLYTELLSQNFWSINADAETELFEMLSENLGIRFADKGKVIPNMEIKFVKDELDQLSLKEKIKVIIAKDQELIISDIPLQIAYKRFVLKSPKDLEDAEHLRKLFNVSDDKINKYQLVFKKYGRL